LGIKLEYCFNREVGERESCKTISKILFNVFESFARDRESQFRRWFEFQFA